MAEAHPFSDKFWDERETWSRDRLESEQLAALKRQLAYVGANSIYYKRAFKEVGFDPAGLKSFDDLSRLPLTKKADYVASVQRQPPWGEFVAAPREQVRRVHFSSGTTAKPAPQFWTEADLTRWADNYARGAWSQGVRPGQVFQCLFTYTWFVGGLGATAGYQRAGAICIPAGSGETERQVHSIYEFGTEIICGTPSFMLHLAETAAKLGYDSAASPVKRIMVGGEPGASIPATRKRIEELWGAKCYDAYGSLEFQTIGWDCEAQTGPHLLEDFAYAEIVDPDTGRTVPDGERGVLVLTHLDKQAGPLVRWWTGDIVSRRREVCACGRTHGRLINGVLGRGDDMLVIRGVNLFPSAVEELIRSTSGTTDEYRIIVGGKLTDAGGFPTGIRLQVEALSDAPADLGQRLSGLIKEKLQVRAEVELLAPDTLARSSHKSKRVIQEPAG
ncbi:phenylacetate--CoA ligase family protein [Ferrovibrio sp.]|uniref:phenylacetate--CoA ligase family protein n=1 Tax=Ferrovibrio sp. TaxID=1917215 RepID=UPI003D2DD67A